MKLDRSARPFQIVGENIHATRVLKRTGKHAVELEDGSVGIAFETPDGDRLVLPVHPDLAAARDFAAGKIKHVQSAVRWGLDDGAQADTAAAYIRTLAHRQEITGADWLDLNVDEVSADSGMRAQAMTWLVATVERTATVPVSIDSSDVAVLAAGVAASGQPRGRLMLNSASIERPEVLDIAADAVVRGHPGRQRRGRHAGQRRGACRQRRPPDRGRDREGHRPGPVLRGPARPARGGVAGRPRPRPRDGSPAPRRATGTRST